MMGGVNKNLKGFRRRWCPQAENLFVLFFDGICMQWTISFLKWVFIVIIIIICIFFLKLAPVFLEFNMTNFHNFLTLIPLKFSFHVSSLMPSYLRAITTMRQTTLRWILLLLLQHWNKKRRRVKWGANWLFRMQSFSFYYCRWMWCAKKIFY